MQKYGTGWSCPFTPQTPGLSRAGQMEGSSQGRLSLDLFRVEFRGQSEEAQRKKLQTGVVSLRVSSPKSPFAFKSVLFEGLIQNTNFLSN